ncbi:MAG: endonuclease/exonuclease/phosphatase family protein [Peptostreptococcaceae bacterium]
MKIISYNIHRGEDINRKQTLKEIIDYLDNLDCDVICLQEVLYNQFIKIKSSLEMDGVFAANVNTKTTKYGVCTLSMNKIKKSNHVLLSSKKEQRGLLNINISTEENYSLNIINTHLGLDKEERNTQIIEILNFKQGLIDTSIICGDLNDKNISINTYYDCAVYFKMDNLVTLPKYNARIDYIFIDKILTPRTYSVENTNFSDHYPIISLI